MERHAVLVWVHSSPKQRTASAGEGSPSQGAAAGSHSAPHNSRALMVGESNPEKPPLISEGHSSSCRAHCSFQLSPQEDSSANPNMVTAPPGRQAEAVQADQQCSVLLPAAQSGWRPGVGTGSGLIQHVHQ